MENAQPAPAGPSVVVSQPLPALSSASSLLKETFKFYASHFSNFLLIAVVPIFVQMTGFYTDRYGFGVSVLVIILSFVTQLFGQVALYYYIVHEGNVEGGALGSYKSGASFIIATTLLSIYTGLAIMGGYALLVVPGIILTARFSIAPILLFAENRRGISALTYSWMYVKGYTGAVLWRFVVFGVVMMVLILLMAAPLFFLSGDESLATNSMEKVHPAAYTGQLIITWLGFMPILLIFFYQLYKSLRLVKPPVVNEIESPAIRKKVIAAIVISIIAFILLFFLLGSLLISRFRTLDSFPNNAVNNSAANVVRSFVSSFRLFPWLNL